MTRILAPDAPIGWPIAIAPPLTLIFEVSQPISLFTAIACAANASLISIRSRSFGVQPAFFSASWLAGTGPIPMIDGSRPAEEYALILTSGFRPSSFAFDADIMMTAAAPSLSPDALPAVTVPSFANAGRRLDSDSTVVPCFGNSSASNFTVPFLLTISNGRISSLNLPAFCAASALFCEAVANSSCSWREIECFFATFSAVVPMWYWL